MSGKADRGVPVTFADGVRDDVASLVASADDDAGASELAALKRRIAELLVECKAKISSATVVRHTRRNS
ncbi:MAG: hypothetical protein WAU69_12285 [Solirubrobacteraceae bacterium]